MFRILFGSALLLATVSFGMQDGIACDSTNPVWESMESSRVILKSNTGKSHELSIKIASNRKQHQAGFQYMCSNIIEKWSMLFVFPKSEDKSFHMQNVNESLDIAFFSKDGRLLSLKKMYHEGKFHEDTSYESNGPFKYALEAKTNKLFSIGLNEGQWRLVLDATWM